MRSLTILLFPEAARVLSTHFSLAPPYIDEDIAGGNLEYISRGRFIAVIIGGAAGEQENIGMLSRNLAAKIIE